MFLTDYQLHAGFVKARGQWWCIFFRSPGVEGVGPRRIRDVVCRTGFRVEQDGEVVDGVDYGSQLFAFYVFPWLLFR